MITWGGNETLLFDKTQAPVQIGENAGLTLKSGGRRTHSRRTHSRRTHSRRTHSRRTHSRRTYTLRKRKTLRKMY